LSAFHFSKNLKQASCSPIPSIKKRQKEPDFSQFLDIFRKKNTLAASAGRFIYPQAPRNDHKSPSFSEIKNAVVLLIYFA
jgi:hypothetical protein